MALAALMAALLGAPLYGDKKKKAEPAPAPPPEKSILEKLDYSLIVWPQPPAITRVRYLDFFAAQKVEAPKPTAVRKKISWMEKMAGGAPPPAREDSKPFFQLITPYGLAVDSKNKLYIADGQVGAVFIFDTETKDLEMIKNGVHASFGLIVGLAIDDDDRLFVSDSGLHHVLVFSPQHKQQASISEGMFDPGGIALDRENRFLYVADTALDQVLVYDADKFTLLRRIGRGGKNHILTDPGDFAKPTNVAVDEDGNLYVSDTLNNRIEIFDADGNFIRTFGKAGDGPDHFARPKGIAIDADGHIWVADSVQDRIQCFNSEGKLLMYIGTHGMLPGQFRALAGLAIDKNNRIFTAEQFPGRVQMFRYITNKEALAEWERRKAAEKKDAEKTQPATQTPASTPPSATPAADAPSKPQVTK
jgi:DNA-binding beta-propeller fold protein YncE